MFLECEKRQRVVKKGGEVFRCLNRNCEAHGQQVIEDQCAVCPMRAYKHVKPCKPHQFNPAQELEARNSELALMKAISTESDDTIVEETPDGSPPPNYPALSTQMWLYKEALLRWNRAGRPVRSDEEVNSILTNHCQTCDWYDASAQRCKGCGCKVTDSGYAVFNKLKMLTEKCPQGKW